MKFNLHRQIKPRIGMLSAFCALCCVTLMPVKAHAGFDWIPPEDAGPQYPPAPLPRVPEPPAPIDDVPANVPMPQNTLEPLVAPGPIAAPAPLNAPSPARVVVPGSVPVGAPLQNIDITPVPAPVAMQGGMDAPAPSAPPARSHGGQIARPTMVEAPMAASINMQQTSAGMMRAVPVLPPSTSEPLEVVNGFGSDIPLVLAMSQVVPPDYAYSFHEHVDPGLVISWNGGKPWDEVLNEALAPHGLAVLVTDKTAWVRPHRQGPTNVNLAQIRPKTLPKYEIKVDSYPQAADDVYTQRDPMNTLDKMIQRHQQKTPYATQAVMPTPAPLLQQDMGAMPAARPVPLDLGGGRVQEDRMNETAGYQQQTPRPPMNAAPMSPQMAPPAAAPASPSMMSPQPLSPMPIGLGAVAPAPSMAPVPQNAEFLPPPVELRPLVPTTATPDIYFWSAKQGESLRLVLENWAAKAGAQLLWDTNYDFVLPETVQTHGTFTSAVSEILAIMRTAGQSPNGKFYANNPDGPPVLVISGAPS